MLTPFSAKNRQEPRENFIDVLRLVFFHRLLGMHMLLPMDATGS